MLAVAGAVAVTGFGGDVAEARDLTDRLPDERFRILQLEPNRDYILAADRNLAVQFPWQGAKGDCIEVTWIHKGDYASIRSVWVDDRWERVSYIPFGKK